MKRILQSVFLTFVLKQPRIRRLITKILFRNENTRVGLFGASYEINKRKESFLYRAFLRSKSLNVFRHEAPQITNLALLLKPNDVFVDVGANVGLQSAVYAKLMHAFPQFIIYAFEPNPDTFERLKKTLGFTEHSEMKSNNLHLFNKGVSDSNSILEFVSGAGSSEFGIWNRSGWQMKNERTLVQCIRLDSIDDLYRYNGDLVLKIDVEGHEWEVLQGCKLLFDLEKIKILLIDGYDNKRIPEYLVGLGFKLFDGYSLKPLSLPSNNSVIIGIHHSRDEFDIEKLC